MWGGDWSGSHGRIGGNAYDRGGAGCNYWGDSNIRSWLNSSAPAGEVEWLCGNPPRELHNWLCDVYNRYDQEKGFLADGNFTETEREAIKVVTQRSVLDPLDAELATEGTAEAWNLFEPALFINPSENHYNELCAEFLEEKIFLLDLQQYWNLHQKEDVLGQYWLAYLTQQAIDNDKYEKYLEQQSYWDEKWRNTTETKIGYFLRTPIRQSDPRINPRDGILQGIYTMIATSTGKWASTYSKLPSTQSSTDGYYGIRPAFYLDENNAVTLSGSGTAEDPYVVDGKKKDEIFVYLNGSEVTFDQPPVTESDRTLVPVRAIVEAMGADVSWEEESRTAIIRFGIQTVRFQIDNPAMQRNEEDVWLDVPPRQFGDRTLVPLRALAEGFGATVDWDEGTKTVTIWW